MADGLLEHLPEATLAVLAVLAVLACQARR